jgi:hypothetical protein
MTLGLSRAGFGVNDQKGVLNLLIVEIRAHNRKCLLRIVIAALMAESPTAIGGPSGESPLRAFRTCS